MHPVVDSSSNLETPFKLYLDSLQSGHSDQISQAS